MVYRANHIVITTINLPDVLHTILSNLKMYNHIDDVKCWVVGDRKTPKDCGRFIRDIKAQGLDVEFLSIEDQDEWGKAYPGFYHLMPYDNDVRRLIGYLHALEAGCERLIVLDDDNYLIDDIDFIGGHLITGSSRNGCLTKSSTGFYNVCEDLVFNIKCPIYPRGYPFRQRSTINKITERDIMYGYMVGVNMGLWLNSPDVDATTWLSLGDVKVDKYKRDPNDKNLVLDNRTWLALNTQNTSVCWELIPIFINVPMKYSISDGMELYRFGDIWGGYIMQAILKGTKYAISFGNPLVNHNRNQHDYLEDLRYEFWGIMLTDWLIDKLKNEFKTNATGFMDRAKDLCGFLLFDCVGDLPRNTPPNLRGFFIKTSQFFYQYIKVCEKIQRKLNG